MLEPKQNMINYRFPEELKILLHYSKIMDDPSIEEIIYRGHVLSTTEAKKLTAFYWAMVDKAVEDNGVGCRFLEEEIAKGNEDSIAHWMEYIFHSLNGYMVSHGYAEEWGR